MLDRDHLQVEALAVVLQARGAVHALQRGDGAGRQAQPATDVGHQFGVVAFHVDPQQLLVLQVADVDLLQPDIAVGAVGVVQDDVGASFGERGLASTVSVRASLRFIGRRVIAGGGLAWRSRVPIAL